MRWDDDRPRLTLPARVLRDLLRTVDRERTAVPAPWLYLASAAAGAAVGAGAAVMIRSGRPVLASAVGASSGAGICWSVFAATALRQPSTWSELHAAGLQQVAPRRAAELRTARQDAVARSGSFQAYGLAHWDGPRLLAGHSTDGSRTTSVQLGHGDLLSRAGPWVLVDTAERRGAEQHTEVQLADALWDDASMAYDLDPSGLDDAAVLAHLRSVREARAARPEPQWHDGTVLVDGRPVPVSWAADGEHWVAHALLDDLSLAVRAYGVPLEDVSLVALHDLDAYASWSA